MFATTVATLETVSQSSSSATATTSSSSVKSDVNALRKSCNKILESTSFVLNPPNLKVSEDKPIQMNPLSKPVKINQTKPSKQKTKRTSQSNNYSVNVQQQSPFSTHTKDTNQTTKKTVKQWKTKAEISFDNYMDSEDKPTIVVKDIDVNKEKSKCEKFYVKNIKSFYPKQQHSQVKTKQPNSVSVAKTNIVSCHVSGNGNIPLNSISKRSLPVTKKSLPHVCFKQLNNQVVTNIKQFSICDKFVLNDCVMLIDEYFPLHVKTKNAMPRGSTVKWVPKGSVIN